MSTLATIRSRILQITVGHIDSQTCADIINRCYQEEVEARPWTFRRTNGVVNAAAPAQGGTIDVTQGSPVITGAGTTFTPDMVGWRLRVGAGASTTGLFTVQSIQSTTQLTLTSVYPGVTISVQGYYLFKQYYSIVGADQILSIQGGNALNLTETTHEEMNRMDPLRLASANPPRSWAPKGRDAADYAQFEFWPISSAAIPFVVEYLAAFAPLVNDADQTLVPGSVVENKALADSCSGIFSETGDPRWDKQSEKFWQRYLKELEEAVMSDAKRYGVQAQVRDLSRGETPGMDLLYNRDI